MITRFIVLGCGHTGTSLISGLLHHNGFGSWFTNHRYECVPLLHLTRSRSSVDKILRRLGGLEKYTGGKWTWKDPRLCDMLHLLMLVPWPVKIIFNFRDPGPTVGHMWRGGYSKEAAENEYLYRNSAVMNFVHSTKIPVLMTCYDDVVEGLLNKELCEFVGKELDFSFVDPTKRKSESVPVPTRVSDVYYELLKEYKNEKH